MASMVEQNQAENYTIDDFNKVEKIDAHVHVNTIDRTILEQAIEDQMIFISINVDAYDDPIEKQQEYAIYQHDHFPDRFFYLTTFRVKGFEKPGWERTVLSYLRHSFANGAVGVKVWKNIGMDEKTSDGRYLMVDDPVFDDIFSFLEINKIPLTGHIGEPRNCWLPLEEMTVIGDRNYYSKNPAYHMYLHPDSPSYEEHIQARDNVLAKHPELVYVGAHLGSMEWNVDELAKRLDLFPLMSVDLAERMCHLQYQSVQNWGKVHDFIIKYQDRLLYGTDIESHGLPEEKKRAHEIWLRDWIYFISDGIMSSPVVVQQFQGMRLPKPVVDKIYSLNAKRIYLRNQP
jgi:hypothetical protein